MCDIEPIPTADLNARNVPSADADFHGVLEPFALTFDGYLDGRRSIDDCFAIVERIEREGFESASLDDLRTAAFICQRAIRANDHMPPDPEWLRTIRAAVAEIRRRVAGGE